MSASPPQPLARQIRLTLSHWTDTHLYGTVAGDADRRMHAFCYATPAHTTFAPLCHQLYAGAQVNLIDVYATDGAAPHPSAELFVLEPDYLIDITSLCACMKPYGWSAYTHVLDLFSAPARSAAIQMGNAANQFLDDLINAPHLPELFGTTGQYLQSMQKSLHTYPLVYSTLDDIGPAFFEQCRNQFDHIAQTVRYDLAAAEVDIQPHEVELEPSFLCEALGLQGRMDLLTTDFSKLVELKSGKYEEYPTPHARDEHRLQMALYKEVLYHNMGMRREQVRSFLLYSRYPAMYAIDASRQEIQAAMALRNAMVHLEQRIRQGQSHEVLRELSEARINTRRRNDRFYHQYLRNDIINPIALLHQMNTQEEAYLCRFMTFIMNEQWMAKTGAPSARGGGGLAETWRADSQTKVNNGDMLTALTLVPVQDEDARITHLRAYSQAKEGACLPNFRIGDMVMLYEHEDEQDKVTNKQFFRLYIEAFADDHILLRLAYPGRYKGVFRADRHYALEPAHTDAAFRQAYSGLMAFARAPQARRELLLGTRTPTWDENRQLTLPVANGELASILTRAKQANDYFLLVGPPGTGKTSVALKAMVEEYLASHPDGRLLLMAYTNRAVDEICAMLATIQPEPTYIRIGQELTCAEPYKGHLLQHRLEGTTRRAEILQLLRQPQLFCGTISSIAATPDLFKLHQFGLAIVDEASQVLEPQLLPLWCALTPKGTCAIDRFILIGDHKQLPAVVAQSIAQSAVSHPQLRQMALYDCRDSLFERLHRLLHQQHLEERLSAWLCRQGRMHPALSDFVNRHFYDSKLTTVPLPHQLEELPSAQGRDNTLDTYIYTTRLGFLDVPPCTPYGHSPKANPAEAACVAHLLLALQQREQQHATRPLYQQVGIIVPFRAQIAQIRQAMRRLAIAHTELFSIDTVERYQGSQRDIIIFCTTISRPGQMALICETADDGTVGIDRKLNVALTRARKQLFVVGCRSALCTVPIYAQLLAHIEARGGLRAWTTPAS